jgi:SAM-dependent methyltransferase
VSFQPLPGILLDALSDLAPDRAPLVVDLGCGDGSLGRPLEQAGARVVGCDRARSHLGSAADVVGDVLSLPILAGTADFLVAGNLVRHLLLQDAAAGFLRRWSSCLRPGGWLFILEDEPRANSRSQQHYLELQGFLRQLNPGQRGPLIDLAHFLQLEGTRSLPGRWHSASQPNSWSPDTDRVMQMLRGTGPEPQGRPGALIKAIGVDGLAYTNYWWAGWQKSLAKG